MRTAGEMLARAIRAAQAGLVYLVDDDGRVAVLTHAEYAALPLEVADAQTVSLTLPEACALAEQRRARS